MTHILLVYTGFAIASAVWSLQIKLKQKQRRSIWEVLFLSVAVLLLPFILVWLIDEGVNQREYVTIHGTATESMGYNVSPYVNKLARQASEIKSRLLQVRELKNENAALRRKVKALAPDGFFADRMIKENNRLRAALQELHGPPPGTDCHCVTCCEFRPCPGQVLGEDVSE